MSHRAATAGLLCLAATLAGGCGEIPPEQGATTANASTPLPIEAVSRYMRHLESYGLSGALLIADHGRVVLDETYGVADRSSGRPVSADTLFDIASVSKQFTATAVLKLQEEGRLRTSDLLAHHLPAVPEDKAGINLHQLLTHTSGISDPQSDAAVPRARDEAVESLLAMPLDQPPGSEYAYSNAGYTLLAAVVERVSGIAFEDYLRSRLFAPARMRATHCIWEARPEFDQLIAIGEGGYEGRFRSGDPRSRPDSWMLRGSGGVLSSTRELWRWYQALVGGEVVSADSLSTLFQPHTTAEVDFLEYGYGWRIQRTTRDTRLIWHSGWEEAFSAVLRSYVDEGVFVAFTSNASVDLVPLREVVLRSARAGTLGEILFEGLVVETPSTTDTPPEQLETLTGRYELDGGGAVRLDLAGGRLELSPEGQAAVEALWPRPGANDPTLTDRGHEALEFAALIRDESVANDDVRFDALDPYGFAQVGVQELRKEWHQLEATLGPWQSVEILGTAWVGLEGRESPVTELRLHFQDGSEDYRLIWYADDEIYLLDGPPRSFRKVLRHFEGRRFVHYDLLTGRSFTVDLEPPNGAAEGLQLTIDGTSTRARRTASF